MRKHTWMMSLGLLGTLAVVGCGSDADEVGPIVDEDAAAQTDAATGGDAGTGRDASAQSDGDVDGGGDAAAQLDGDVDGGGDAAVQLDGDVDGGGDAGTEPDVYVGPATVTRTSYVLAGDDCPHGGEQIESGLDANESGELDDDEVDASATQLQCRSLPAYTELDPLPAVTTVWSFALTASVDDGSPRLGYMFTDPDYRTAVNDVLSDLGGGVYDGPNTYVTYQLTDSTWQPYEGRGTPQTYAHSELVVEGGASYYTTNYPIFTGLVAVIRNGGKGTYALTPTTTTRKQHSIAVPLGSADLYALIAQKTPGLTFSRFPINEFGNLSNKWVNLATLDDAASTVSAPQLVVAGGAIVASYLQGTAAVVRATNDPAAVTAASDMPVIGGCDDAVLADIAWDGSYVYLACVDSAGVFSLQHGSLAADLSSVTFETVATSVIGKVDALDLEGSGMSSTGIALAIRQGTAVRVYADVRDPGPAFDEASLSGDLDLASTARGPVLVVDDMAGDRTLRTFVAP